MHRAPLDGSSEPSWEDPCPWPPGPGLPEPVWVKSTSSKTLGSTIPAFSKWKRQSCRHLIKYRDRTARRLPPALDYYSRVLWWTHSFWESTALGSDQVHVAEFSLDPPWKCDLQESHAVLPTLLQGRSEVSEMARPREVRSSFRLPQGLFLGFFLGNLIPLLPEGLCNSDFILMRWGRGSLNLSPSIHLSLGLGDWSVTSMGQSAPPPGQWSLSWRREAFFDPSGRH